MRTFGKVRTFGRSGVYYMCCGDINLIIHSDCGDVGTHLNIVGTYFEDKMQVPKSLQF